VLLLDHAPGEEELRRIQAQENPREPLSLRDQQEQFRDCWQARAGLPEADRIAVVCADLGISTGKGHSLRRQLALPDPIRERVAERPAGDQLSVRMAHRLADMHDIAPELAAAVARRVTTGDLHDQALRDLGGFVHRTVVENDDVYAVRIDDGVLLDAAEQIDHARRHLTPADRTQAAAALGCKTDKLDAELDARAARGRSHALKLRVDGALRDRAAKAATPGRSTAARTSPRASGSSTPSSWSTPSASSSATPTPRPSARIAISLALDSTTTTCASPPRTTASAGPPSGARHAEATTSNLGLSHDIRAALADPTDDQLHAVREIVCRLLHALPRRHRLRRRLDRPRAPAACRRHRPPRARPRRWRGQERHDLRAHRGPGQHHRGCAHMVEHGEQVGDVDCHPVRPGQRRATPAAAQVGGQEARASVQLTRHRSPRHQRSGHAVSGEHDVLSRVRGGPSRAT